jgi:acyl-CoA synthetase (AMP-forming)/AMP-acid ligase II
MQIGGGGIKSSLDGERTALGKALAQVFCADDLLGSTQQFGERRLISLGERRIGYAEAAAESAQLARGLLARGVGKGTRVGLLFPNGPDWVISWLAAARIGALVVPLNTFYKARELGWTLRHADVHTLLTTAKLKFAP